MTALFRLSMGRLPFVACLAPVFLAGCSDEFLMTSYKVAPESPAFVSEVRRGDRQISEIFTGTPCLLTVDNDATPLQSTKSGTLGQTGFNITVNSSNPSNAATNDPSCPAITALSINVGGASEALGVGSTTDQMRLAVTVDGTNYSTDSPGGYFKSTITGQNRSNDTVSASFEGIATAPGSSSMVVTQGSFNIR